MIKQINNFYSIDKIVCAKCLKEYDIYKYIKDNCNEGFFEMECENPNCNSKLKVTYNSCIKVNTLCE